MLIPEVASRPGEIQFLGIRGICDDGIVCRLLRTPKFPEPSCVVSAAQPSAFSYGGDFEKFLPYVSLTTLPILPFIGLAQEPRLCRPASPGHFRIPRQEVNREEITSGWCWMSSALSPPIPLHAPMIPADPRRLLLRVRLMTFEAAFVTALFESPASNSPPRYHLTDNSAVPLRMSVKVSVCIVPTVSLSHRRGEQELKSADRTLEP